MPSLLKLIRNRKKNNCSNKASFNVETAGDVVRDLTAFSSTSKSSPSNSSSGSSTSNDGQSRGKQFGKGSNKIFRRMNSPQNLLTRKSSSCGGEDEASHVSSLTSSVFNETSAMEKIDTPAGTLLKSTLQELSNHADDDVYKDNYRTSQRNVASKDTLRQFRKQIAIKNAKIRYLNTLTKELKSLYRNKLEGKDLEIARLRKDLHNSAKELSETKERLAEAIEGHTKLMDSVAKKSKEDLYWFSPVLGAFQLN
jgi:hypothetical protein